MSLVGWGQAGSGDIDILDQGDGALLILQGYLSAALRIANFGSRGSVSQQIKEQLRETKSLEAVASLTRELNGAFSILYVDLLEKSVCVLCDRMATRPVWFGGSSQTLHISSHSFAVCQAGSFREYDLSTLASVLLYAASVDPRRALFRGVSSQPPATVARYRASGLVEQSSYYQFRHAPELKRSRKEWTQLVAERLRAAACRTLAAWGEPLVFLSGGVDSRLAAAALASTGVAPRCLTIGDGENLETRTAARVAKALRARHGLHVRDRYYYLRQLRRAVFESGGRYRWRHSHFSGAYRAAMDEMPNAVAYLGDFAEAFSKLLCDVGPGNGSPFSLEQFSNGFDRLPLIPYRPLNRRGTLQLLQPNVARQAEAELQQCIRQRFLLLADAAKDRKIFADFFFRWADASAQPTFQMFLDVRSVGPERNLMFDTDVQSLLEILPSSIRDSTGFGAAVVCALHERAGRVADSNTLLPLIVPKPFHRLSRKVRPLVGRARRAFGSNTYRTTASWSLLTRLYASDRRWRGEFESILLNDQLFDPDIFNLPEIASAWRRFVAGQDKDYQDLENLWSFGIVQESALAGSRIGAEALEPSI